MKRQGGNCKCPWSTPFQMWPAHLLGTVKAMVHRPGGPRENN